MPNPLPRAATGGVFQDKAVILKEFGRKRTESGDHHVTASHLQQLANCVGKSTADWSADSCTIQLNFSVLPLSTFFVTTIVLPLLKYGESTCTYAAGLNTFKKLLKRAKRDHNTRQNLQTVANSLLELSAPLMTRRVARLTPR